jgi:hypothetical protein
MCALGLPTPRLSANWIGSDPFDVIGQPLQRLAHLFRVGSAIVDARRARPRLSARTDDVRVGIVILVLADQAR